MKFIVYCLPLAAYSALSVFRGVGDSTAQGLSPNSYINLGQLQLEKVQKVNAFGHHHHGHGRKLNLFGIVAIPLNVAPQYPPAGAVYALPYGVNEQYAASLFNPNVRANVRPTTQITVGSLNNANQKTD